MLRLLALDSDDLSVLSAHLQDAQVRFGDIVWRPSERRLMLLAREPLIPGRLFGLRIDRVDRAELLNLTADDAGAELSLLGALFEPATEPSGRIVLLFAGGHSIRLTVECIEVVLGELAAQEAVVPPSDGA